MLETLAACLNHSIVHLGDFSATSDTELLSLYARWHSEIGDVAREVSGALESDRLTRDDFHRIRKEGIEQVRWLFEFLARIEALVES